MPTNKSLRIGSTVLVCLNVVGSIDIDSVWVTVTNMSKNTVTVKVEDVQKYGDNLIIDKSDIVTVY
jgi:hypothetical protein